MDTDHKVINKFLELFPDSVADSFFYSLDQNMIHDDDDLTVAREYLSYVRKFPLLFLIKKLRISYLKFHSDFNILDTFILQYFFRVQGTFELSPDIKITNPTKFKKLAENLAVLIENAENSHSFFRKLAQDELLKNVSEYQISQNVKYSNVNEPIKIKTLGITINKGIIQKKGKDDIVLNKTDKALVNFLYLESQKNMDDTFSVEQLASMFDVTEKYLRNRITHINNSILEIISKTVKVKIGKFITKKKDHGYYLNPRILHIKK